jgi:hypothetical protein
VNPWDGKWTRQRGYFTAYDVRVRMYRGVMAGGAGSTYGHHHIWQFLNTALYETVNVADTIIPWRQALHAKAATQMIHLKNLFEPLMNDTRMLSKDLVTSNNGKDYKDLILAMIEQQYKYALIHIPFKQKVSLDLSKFKSKNLTISVFDPRNGKRTETKLVQNIQTDFEPKGSLEDYVLIINSKN